VISDLTVSHGANGAIRNAGTTTLERVTVSNSHDQNSIGGGGIYNSGTLTVSNSTIENNTAAGSYPYSPSGGGGIYNSGTLAMDSSWSGRTTTASLAGASSTSAH